MNPTEAYVLAKNGVHGADANLSIFAYCFGNEDAKIPDYAVIENALCSAEWQANTTFFRKLVEVWRAWLPFVSPEAAMLPWFRVRPLKCVNIGADEIADYAANSGRRHDDIVEAMWTCSQAEDARSQRFLVFRAASACSFVGISEKFIINIFVDMLDEMIEDGVWEAADKAFVAAFQSLDRGLASRIAFAASRRVPSWFGEYYPESQRVVHDCCVAYARLRVALWRYRWVIKERACIRLDRPGSGARYLRDHMHGGGQCHGSSDCDAHER